MHLNFEFVADSDLHEALAVLAIGYPVLQLPGYRQPILNPVLVIKYVKQCKWCTYTKYL